VTADEKRGLLYVVTCEHSYWMLYDLKHPEKGYRLLGPKNGTAEMKMRYLLGQPNTLVDKDGRATEITADYRIVRYDPATDQVTLDALTLDDKSIPDTIAEALKRYKYSDCFDWRLAGDGRTAYLVFLSDLRLFQIDLGGKVGEPVRGKSVGNRVQGKHPDSRGSISIGPDGRVYSAVRIDNETGFGTGLLHHLARFDPRTNRMADLGVVAVENPSFFDFQGPQARNQDGSLRPRHGFHTLPDGTLTPLHVILALIVARDGTVYATTIYPFTLLRITAVT
jgi:hypothetical protein